MMSKGRVNYSSVPHMAFMHWMHRYGVHAPYRITDQPPLNVNT